jgi:hypothetical protein
MFVPSASVCQLGIWQLAGAAQQGCGVSAINEQPDSQRTYAHQTP